MINCPDCKRRRVPPAADKLLFCNCGATISADGKVVERRERSKPAKSQVITPRAQCVFLGDEVDRVVCAPCGNGTKLKVFACDKYGKSTIGKKLPDIQCCKQCTDYQSLSAPVTTE